MTEYVVPEAEFSVFFCEIAPFLDEQQLRLVSGAASRMLGHGGIAAVARVSGLDRGRVSRGAKEAESGGTRGPRARTPGGGRKRLTDSQPGIEDALDGMMEPVTRGDLVTPLRWTTKSVRHLADALVALGFQISPMSVWNLLVRLGYSLQATTKALEGADHPDRDDQFRYIAALVTRFQAQGQPVTSCDARMKEQVGRHTSGGREWQPKGQPVPVEDHDFPDPSRPKAVFHGVDDLTGNTGWISVGLSPDTAELAVNTIRAWWHRMGRVAYPNANRLLVTIEAGGSNGYRNRLWKKLLCEFALEEELGITVCHFPPGTSKWNQIEHRMFSHITMNWRGRPLETYQTVVSLIGSTTISKGLKIDAALDEPMDMTGINVTKDEFESLSIHPHLFHGEWNYTVGNLTNTE